MSGFFAAFCEHGREIPRTVLERAAEALRFRGSDGQMTWNGTGVATCFSFLETGPAKQSEQQPVRLGANWMLGDVRVDGRAELLKELASHGTQLSIDTTSEELLLHVWQVWGASCLERIIGDFSFVLWDEAEQCLWCARDFVGPRPFYYAHRNGLFCVSNTLEALRCVPDISCDLDEAFIGEFLLQGYCADLTRTVYSEIQRLRAGHLLKYQKQRLEIFPFATLPVEEPHNYSRIEEYLEQYRHLLNESVRDRLPTRPTGLYLSGGLDSGSVCAMACRIAEERGPGQKELLEAFTVSWFPIFEDPEPEFATMTAKHLGISHRVLDAEGLTPFESHEAFPLRSPEPTAEAFAARAHHNYLEIAAHSPMILSGDGGDDVLTGQSWPYFAHLWSSGKWPEIARVLGSFVLSHGALPPLRAGLRGKLRTVLAGTDPFGDYPDWFNPEFEKRNGLREKWIAAAPSPESTHPVHPQAYAALHRGYWSSVLESEDAGNTRVVLETRAPLLDLRVLRFLLRVPPVPWCVDKELTRLAMAGYLPERILKRPKTPLAKDPLEVCRTTGKWSPAAPKSPIPRIHEFVNWQRYLETLKPYKGYAYAQNLFVVALADWLKDVENVRGIQ